MSCMSIDDRMKRAEAEINDLKQSVRVLLKSYSGNNTNDEANYLGEASGGAKKQGTRRGNRGNRRSRRNNYRR